MRRFHKFNTVFHKLIFSYGILILITIIFVGFTSYLYFSSKFNKQVEKVNDHILSHLKQTIEDNIIDKVEAAYFELVADSWQNSPSLFLFDYPLEGNHPTINAVYQQLNTLVNYNADLFDSIGIYYSDLDVLISSSSGITYLQEEVTIDLSWLHIARQSHQRSTWIEARKMATNIHSDSNVSNIVTFVSSYPNKANSKGYIAFHLKESAFHRIIQSIAPYEKGQFYLLNDQGQLLSHSDTSLLFSNFNHYEFIDIIKDSPLESENFIYQSNNAKTLVSYMNIPGVQWKLINHTPVDEFYKSTTPIRNTLILICLIAIVIGLIVSNFFTIRIYNPLKTIIQGTRQFFGNQQLPLDTKNEYQIIDNVITNLSVKVNTLKDTLETNMPLIKHNLIISLIHNTISNHNELADRLRLLNLQLHGSSFRSCTFYLDSDTLNSLTMENSQFIKYNLISYIDNHSQSDTLLLTTVLAENQICTIACTESDVFDDFLKLADNVISYTQSNFKIDVIAVIGTQVNNPLDFHLSFKDSQVLMKYHYFMPERKVLHGENLLHREHHTEEIPEEALERLATSLRTNDIHEIRTEVNNLISLMRTEHYSADHCHQKLRDIVTIFRNYLKDMYVKSDEAIGSEQLERFKMIKNVAQFKQWLLQSIEAAIANMNDRQVNKNAAIIQKAKEYIVANLDTPLSLDTVAEHIVISPRYLSKLFKEDAGMNFTDFVTSTRMETARDLIISTNDTIEQISYKVGFNSSAYFIRKFREKYGVTPRNFKHNYHLQNDRIS
ncbi:helix-turn-helix domain-containing protein [Paenibacillus chungangensis]|uniref:Helix-turn-helix domain-containing protein n=1 Tax=Paenibacillus chungangensis TaxID=696535 RepID=A0ABW3HR92_9BACL